MRTIGSTGGLYSDVSIPIAERATRLLVDTLSGIHDQIIDYITQEDNTIDLAILVPILDELARSITEVKIIGSVESENTYENSDNCDSTTSANVGMKDISLRFKTSDSSAMKLSKRNSITGIEAHRVHFPSVQNCFEKITKIIAPKEIWIILDEWAEIPLDLQPFLADLLRRTLFPIFGVSVKIGAIEHRSQFRVSRSTSDYIGMEVGADITSLNLDEFMVFDNNEYTSLDFFKN